MPVSRRIGEIVSLYYIISLPFILLPAKVVPPSLPIVTTGRLHVHLQGRLIYIYIYIYIYICICIWRALFQKAISANPIIEVVIAMPISEIMFWKRDIHKYVHVYAVVHTCKHNFFNHNNQTWHWHYKPILFIMALNAFWKRGLHI